MMEGWKEQPTKSPERTMLGKFKEEQASTVTVGEGRGDR